LAARLAAVLGVPHVELDAVFHQPGWQELDRDRFQDEVRALSAGDGWVIDGNYSAVREIVWRRADTVVFLDLPRRRVMRSVITRSLSRVLRRTELWNGNRETVANVLHPRDSIVVWAWTQHAKYGKRYGAAMHDPAWDHLDFVRLRSRREANAWLDRLRATAD
jgi:adenylate kinase family enzyme